MKKFDVIAAVLLIIGGLNWGLIGVGGPDLVASLFGEASGMSRLVYGLVGVSALWQALQWKAIQQRWLSRPTAAMSAAVLTLMAVGTLQAQSAQEKATEPMSIVQTAISAGQFKTLASALQAADLVPALEGAGPFTVFAPTDAAFAKLPKGTLEALLKDKAKLTAILTYHVVPGVVTAAELASRADMKGNVMLKTLNGADIRIHQMGKSVHVGDKMSNVTGADVRASNGIIHIIDAVVLPPQ
jgi:uncharacterized surface protein with fasciclin (FAS1) repeats